MNLVYRVNEFLPTLKNGVLGDSAGGVVALLPSHPSSPFPAPRRAGK